MAFKMKGAPMHDTSSKHGTNANYQKSGAPGLLGKILDPLGLKKKIFGGDKGGNCPPQQAAQAQIGGAKPVEPVTPAAAAPAAAAPAAAAAPDPAAAAPMKEGLKNGAPMCSDCEKASPARDTKYFGQNTSWDEVDAVTKHNKKHSRKKNPLDKNHVPKGRIPVIRDSKVVDPGQKASLSKKKKGAPMKASPAKGIWDDIKSGASKAYDKASQVGMGVKKAAGEMGMYEGDYTDKPKSIGSRLKTIKKAYVRGRDTEERHDRRGGGKGKYKGGRSDEKAFMEKHAKNWRKKDVDVYGKGKEAQRIANEKEDARGREVARRQYNKGAK